MRGDVGSERVPLRHHPNHHRHHPHHRCGRHSRSRHWMAKSSSAGNGGSSGQAWSDPRHHRASTSGSASRQHRSWHPICATPAKAAAVILSARSGHRLGSSPSRSRCIADRQNWARWVLAPSRRVDVGPHMAGAVLIGWCRHDQTDRSRPRHLDQNQAEGWPVVR
jgi:hypothetical protein